MYLKMIKRYVGPLFAISAEPSDDKDTCRHSREGKVLDYSEGDQQCKDALFIPTSYSVVLERPINADFRTWLRCVVETKLKHKVSDC